MTVRGGARNGDDTAEIGHLVSATYAGGASTARQGWMPGNLANMCHTCNADAGKVDKSVTADEVDATLVPLTWPTFRKKVKGESVHASNARANRKW
jgi:hypothetical protein